MPLKTHQDEQPTLNLTPMIDIVFLLIIFFMVGTKFAEMERTVQLEVPKVGDLGGRQQRLADGRSRICEESDGARRRRSQ